MYVIVESVAVKGGAAKQQLANLSELSPLLSSHFSTPSNSPFNPHHRRHQDYHQHHRYHYYLHNLLPAWHPRQPPHQANAENKNGKMLRAHFTAQSESSERDWDALLTLRRARDAFPAKSKLPTKAHAKLKA